MPSNPSDRSAKPGDQGHYFDSSPTGRSDEQTVDVVLPDVGFTLTTDHGVFSHGHLDTGTAVLLRSDIDVPPAGDLVDLGCGAGPIALALAKRSPDATVWAVDVNERARQLCRSNAKRNGLANIRVITPDEFPDDGRIAGLWSNPPIRIGKQPLRQLLSQWLGRLDADGIAALVVQKHLGADSLQRWIDSEGFSTERVASKAGFRVLRVVR